MSDVLDVCCPGCPIVRLCVGWLYEHRFAVLILLNILNIVYRMIKYNIKKNYQTLSQLRGISDEKERQRSTNCKIKQRYKACTEVGSLKNKAPLSVWQYLHQNLTIFTSKVDNISFKIWQYFLQNLTIFVSIFDYIWQHRLRWESQTYAASSKDEKILKQ